MINRRKFLVAGAGLLGAATLGSAISSCEPRRTITGELGGPNAKLGHRLRQASFQVPADIHQQDIVIVGGGISALAAARHLTQAGASFTLLEMEQRVGGNSSSGENAVSPYPLGAHYLTIPSIEDKELVQFFKECNIITGMEHGKPVYNDYHLCFDPKERLYINNQWQEGLVPQQGISPSDSNEIERFLTLMEEYKHMTGSDGREAFCLPIDHCSHDPAIVKLDSLSFHDFLAQQKFQSPSLHWYINYCCADDFGATTEFVSAWAGIHYFACHKGVAANAPSDAVLTWPEGNGWIVSQLKKIAEKNIVNNALVYSIQLTNGKVNVDFLDAVENVTKRIVAEKVVVATPQFINQRILSPSLNRTLDYSAFQYAPWMVANLTVSESLSSKRGEPLSWDNVIYGSTALGYVNARQQQLEPNVGPNIVTYYAPLLGADNGQLRQHAFSKTYQQWYDEVVSDLRKPHPQLEQYLQSMDVWVWGHGMIRPSVNFMSGEDRIRAKKAIGNQIFFAHSDLSGISVFDEAFYHGTKAAKALLS